MADMDRTRLNQRFQNIDAAAFGLARLGAGKADHFRPLLCLNARQGGWRRSALGQTSDDRRHGRLPVCQWQARRALGRAGPICASASGWSTAAATEEIPTSAEHQNASHKDHVMSALGPEAGSVSFVCGAGANSVFRSTFVLLN